jgi:hypothetical protein
MLVFFDTSTKRNEENVKSMGYVVVEIIMALVWVWFQASFDVEEMERRSVSVLRIWVFGGSIHFFDVVSVNNNFHRK